MPRLRCATHNLRKFTFNLVDILGMYFQSASSKLFTFKSLVKTVQVKISQSGGCLHRKHHIECSFGCAKVFVIIVNLCGGRAGPLLGVCVCSFVRAPELCN